MNICVVSLFKLIILRNNIRIQMTALWRGAFLGKRILTICNVSFIQGVFPTKLKRAKVISILKWEEK